MTRPVHLDEAEVERQALGADVSPEHLAGCPQCTASVARARSRRALLGALPEVSLHEAAFRRVERNLFAPPPPPRWRWLFAPALGLAMAAAVFVFFVRLPPAEPQPSPLAVVPTAPEPAPPQASLASAAPQFVQGEVELQREDGSWGPLELERPLSEGASIRTAEGRLAVLLEPGRGFVVEPNSSLELRRLRVGQTHLRLSAGAVYCSLSPLRAGESFAVEAGPRWVRVVGTAFAVTRWPTRVSVEVEHGTVSVADDERSPAGVLVRGPGELELPDGADLGMLSARPLGPEQVGPLAARPAWKLAAGQAPPLAMLWVTEPAGAQVQVDELGWGPVPLAGKLPLGSHRVRARIDGTEVDTTVVLMQGGGPLQVQLARPAVRRAPPVPDGSKQLAAEISSLIAGRTRDLRYCYEHWLKRNPTAAGTLEFKFRLSDDRAIASLDVLPGAGAAPPDEAARRCFAQAVEGLSFPPAAPSELEVPFDFKPGHVAD